MSATASRRARARDRRAGRLRTHLPLHPGAGDLAPSLLGALAHDDLDDYCGFVREHTDLRLGIEADFVPGARGPHGEPAGGARLRLRGRLGALPARGRGGHGRLQRLGQRAQRRADLAALLRDDRRVGRQRPVRHHRPPRPREVLGPPAPPTRAAAGGRPAPLLRARRRGIAAAASPWRCPRPACASPRGRSTPPPRSCRCALEAGVPVALSSDAHRPQDVGAGYEQALEMLQRLGVGELCVFEGRRERRLDADRRERAAVRAPSSATRSRRARAAPRQR